MYLSEVNFELALASTVKILILTAAYPVSSL